jgi:tetraacyldisaccharide 4'-kinase
MRNLLLPFSLLYWLGVDVRNWFFDIGILKTVKVSVPVISIGNISTGGVGKTPFVALLIEKLNNSPRTAVISRGYNRKTDGTVIVSDSHGKLSSVEDSGDEPMQLALTYPELIVVVDEDRVRGARKAIEIGAKMILLDDGFQHRYLHRDLNIVILTAEEILNGDLLLPAGNRREPLSSLNRADLIAVSRCADIKEYEHVCAVGRECKSLPAKTPTIGLKTKLETFKRISSNEIMEADNLINKNIIAFSGIGNPKSFEELMIKANVKVVKHIVFSDHYWYKDYDIRAIVDARKQFNADFIVTTEKDATRLRERFAKFLETELVIVAEIRQEIISGGNKLNELLKHIN